MAQIQPPETFDFSTPNEWPKWRKRFERYLVVSGMKKKEEADKIDLFMYLMGDRADDIFRTFKFEKEEEATKIDSVLKAFDSHFCVRKNIIYERAKFNSRNQEDREPVDEFITSLYKLADSCEFEGLHEQLIRDRIVVGVRDKALSERMQLDSELTLEKAVKMVRQQEAVRQQQVDLQRPSTSQRVNQVKFNSKKQSPKQQQQPSMKKEKSAKTRSRCPKCGGFTHREGQACRAEGQRCNLCSKTGHFANCCPDKQAKTAEVKAVSELEEIGFLLEVSAVEDSSNLDNDEDECRRRWTAEIQVNGKKVKFKLDSQADVTCVPLCLFKKIMGQQRLVKSDINIRAAEFSELQTVGMSISTLRNGNYEIKEKIYVIRRLSEPLLSRRACELLNLARRIEVGATRINPVKEFPEVHIPGKELLDADALSRQLLTTEGGEDERPTSAHINAVLSSITDKDEMLTKIFEAQQEDTTLKAVVNYLEQGWPDKKKMSQALLSYWHVKDELGVQNGLLMRSCRLVIPASMKLEILDKLHAGHFGITKTRLRARETVWWPGISEEIAETIGMDLFKFENKWYLVVIDYYSRFPEMIQLDRLTANVVVRSCKSIFARHGIPETVVSDNGTQFGAAREFANFARQYGFTHVTSSPRFPQSNGMAEAGVKIAKLILNKNQDPSLGLLEYRSTPLENGYSPAELLMGRKLRTTLPIAPENLNPKLVDSQTLKRKEGRRRKDMKSRYDRRCGATDMEELSEGDTVWITDMRTWGIVKQKASTPRSYMVDTPVGTLRRNRFHLRKGVTVQYPADPSTPTFSGEELVENENTPVVDYPSNDSEDGHIRTRNLNIIPPSLNVKALVRTSFGRQIARRASLQFVKARIQESHRMVHIQRQCLASQRNAISEILDGNHMKSLEESIQRGINKIEERLMITMRNKLDRWAPRIKKVDPRRDNKKKQNKFELEKTKRSEWEAIKKLKNNDDIVITRADKGGKTVVMKKEDYNDKIKSLLNDNNTYEEIREDSTKKIKLKISKFIKNMKSKDIDKRKMKLEDVAAPLFKGLPKIHKEGVPLRPIVSGFKAPTRRLADWLKKQVPSTSKISGLEIRNRKELLDIAKNLKLNDHEIMVSFDVKSLFTNINRTLALKEIREYFEVKRQDCENKGLEINEMIEGFRLCLDNIYFRYGNKFYKQKDGTAMGCPTSMIIADIVMASVDKKAILIEGIRIWGRYIDDVFAVIRKENLNEIMVMLNNLERGIEFTVETEKEGFLSFLDVGLTRKEDGSILTSVFRKPTDCGIHLNFNSNNPMIHKRQVIKSLVQRAKQVRYTHLQKMENSVQVPKFDGKNFASWKFRIVSILEGKELDDLLECDPPEDEVKFKEWKKKDAQAKGIITCAMTDSLVALILNCKTSKSIWIALHERYEGDKKKRIIEARNDVSRLTMKKEENWEEYLYRSEKLLEQARNLGAEIEDQEFTTSVIRGLPQKYNLVALQLNSQMKVSISDLKNCLKLYHERFTHEEKEGNSKAFNTIHKESFSNSKHFHKNRNSNKPICFICAKPGHKAIECWHNPKNNRASENKQTSKNKPEHQNKAKFVNLQPEEHVSNIKEYETTQQPEEWVIDSGASCQMTSNRDLLKEEREVHKTIKLADDSEIISNAEEAIEIEGQNKLIRLNDVLYVEKLSAHNFNTQSQNMDTCQVCIQAKHPRTPFKPVLYPQSTRPLDLIHIDLIGPIQEESIGGAKYVLTLVDDFSRKIFVEFLSSKLETFDIIRSFIEEIEKEKEIKVKQLRSDNGKEFTNHQMTQYLKGKGIKHQLTNVYTPQQNGFSERYNRTLIEGTRALLIDSQLPLRYWAETMSTFAYLKNRTPCKKLGWITPEERFSNRKPTVAHLKIFGCIAYYYVHKHKRGKFQPTAKAGIFVGYSSTRKAWRLIDPENENVIETRDVKFLENKLGKEILNKNDSDDTQKYFLYNFPEETIPETSEEVENHDDHSHSDLENQDEHSELPYNLRPNLKDKLYYELSSDDEPIEDNEDKDPTYDPTVGALKLSHGNLLPSSYEEAINHPDSPLWQQAMDKEIHSLQNHHVWDLTELPEGAKAIKSKWIFSKKMDPQTNQEIYKARLVALGCSQEYGTDYTETFSPVMKTDSFRTLLAYATMAGYEFHHFDVETAFLYGKLSETIYMTQPPGYQDDKKKTYVCILNQALYGLKQSGRVWYETFTEYLFEIGLTQLKSDKCVFTFRNGNSHLLLGLHVDDMIIINSNPEILHDIIQKIRLHFKIKESLTTCNILGIEIIKEDVRLILKQENYINKILQKYNMQDCKHISTPLDPNTNLDNFNSSKEVNKTQYQELIGSLLYLSTKSRPDIAFAVTLLSRYNQNPREMHMGAAKRILRLTQMHHGFVADPIQQDQLLD
ncbi:hypothetical protein LAZ67_3001645 [Cordylochernes scorpioides]|uniref:RNA-directed DNA polymerase n=1 Tax=Cordylochernes scorpioides TaxID=51811 RepID=A0ABY6K734_9ARAC|nr:hypothetical protein LAZ67_3001645 [Cordylochernes scorpioides]